MRSSQIHFLETDIFKSLNIYKSVNCHSIIELQFAFAVGRLHKQFRNWNIHLEQREHNVNLLTRSMKHGVTYDR